MTISSASVEALARSTPTRRHTPAMSRYSDLRLREVRRCASAGPDANRALERNQPPLSMLRSEGLQLLEFPRLRELWIYRP